MKKVISTHYKIIILIILLIISTYFTSRFLLQFALIQGKSMEPTYHSMQLVMVSKCSSQYDRGDVILFYSDSPDAVLIKRIIGIPGDTIQIKKSTLYINDKPYTQDSCLQSLSVAYNDIKYAGIAEQPITLDTSSYFVLGYNLFQSKDSRYQNIGCVQSQYILGKVISFPLSH